MQFEFCFDRSHLPSIANANMLTMHALQRYVTPIVIAELEKTFDDAERMNEKSSNQSKKSQVLFFFQKELQSKANKDAAKSKLLARVLSAGNEPSAVQCVSLVENSLFACVHTLLASQPSTIYLFGNKNTHRMRHIKMRCTPLSFLHNCFLTACTVAFEQPFLFLRNGKPQEYIAKKREIVALVDELVEAQIYDECAHAIANMRSLFGLQTSLDQSNSESSVSKASASKSKSTKSTNKSFSRAVESAPSTSFSRAVESAPHDLADSHVGEEDESAHMIAVDLPGSFGENSKTLSRSSTSQRSTSQKSILDHQTPNVVLLD